MNDFEAHLNYKCTFELRCSAKEPVDLLSLCTEKVVSWLCKKYNINALDTPILRTKEYKYSDRFSRFVIHCDFFDDGSNEYAIYIIEEHDKDHKHSRTWSTEIGFHSHKLNSLQVSFTNYYLNHNGYCGTLPSEPKCTVPSIAKSLLRWDKGESIYPYFSNSKVQISSKPCKYISPSLHHLLSLPRSYGTIIIIGKTINSCTNSYRSIIDPFHLANIVYGNALVWYQEPEIDYNNQRIEVLGKEYNSNSILVISPLRNGKQLVETLRLDACEKDSYESEIESVLFRIACQHFSVQEYSYVVRKQTLDKLKITRQAAYRMDVLMGTLKYEKEISNRIHTLLSEMEKLRLENSDLENDNNDFQQLLESADKENHDYKQKLLECNYKVKHFEEALSQKRDISYPNFAEYLLDGYPDCSQLLNLFISIFPNDFAKTDEFESNVKDCKSSIDLIWEALCCFYNYILPSYRNNNPNRTKDVEDNTKFELKERESQQTMNRFKNEREGHWDNSIICAEPHLSTKNWNKANPEKNLRIYFYYDQSKEIIVIHSIGKHFQTEGTKRRKES